MADFIRLFAPHIDAEQMDKATRAVSQLDVDQLFKDTTLPLRNGSCGSLSAASSTLSNKPTAALSTGR
jgi:hypothetical protein